MSLQLITDAGTIKIPGAVVQVSVQATAAGLGTTGILSIVGEAEQGLDFSAETDLEENCSFGPDQEADVIAKYGSGPIVDAFAAALAPSSDQEIQGAPARIVCVKTNVSQYATGVLKNFAAGTWATSRALAPGARGNLYAETVTAAVSEVIPTTGAFALLVPIANTNVDFRVNGGAAVPYTLTAGDIPSVTVAGIDALAGVAATGGADRGAIGSAAGTLALAVVSGNQVTFTRSVAWSVVPTVGDVVFVSATSVVKGGANQNAGSYVVTAVTPTIISATKLLDQAGTPNQLTSPVNVGAQAIVSTTADLRAFAPAVISLEAGNPSDGLGKTLEASELTSASGRLSYVAYTTGGAAVSWISKTGAATDLASASEYQAKLNVARQLDSVNEDVVAGGDVLLQLGYLGTTGSAVIANGTMTVTVVGGAGASPAAISLAQFSTVADLAAYLATLTGFAAAVGSAAVGSRPSTDLDSGTFTIASTFGAKNGRIKGDASKMKAAIAASGNVRLSGTLPTAGLPAPTAAAFMAGGTRGGTSDAQYAAAMTALEGVDCNFVNPLFSCDAATDIADGLTDASSTYSIAAVNANSLSHALKMRQLKSYSPRQACLSFRGTFAQARAAGANIASELGIMNFEDVRNPSATTGSIVQFRPWVASVVAAAYQAAAFRKAIFNKGVNIVGALQAAGDFNPKTGSQVENAFDAGLMVIRKAKGGGWQFASDQTCYTKDPNALLNSFQAVYGIHIIGRTLQQDLENAIVGQSVADVGREQVLQVLRESADSLFKLKLLARSDDAPRGYKNEDAKVNPPSVSVSIEVKEATALYFVRINLSVSLVSQNG